VLLQLAQQRLLVSQRKEALLAWQLPRLQLLLLLLLLLLVRR
jgi:hypothetical protein